MGRSNTPHGEKEYSPWGEGILPMVRSDTPHGERQKSPWGEGILPVGRSKTPRGEKECPPWGEAILPVELAPSCLSLVCMISAYGMYNKTGMFVANARFKRFCYTFHAFQKRLSQTIFPRMMDESGSVLVRAREKMPTVTLSGSRTGTKKEEECSPTATH